MIRLIIAIQVQGMWRDLFRTAKPLIKQEAKKSGVSYRLILKHFKKKNMKIINDFCTKVVRGAAI